VKGVSNNKGHEAESNALKHNISLQREIERAEKSLDTS